MMETTLQSECVYNGKIIRVERDEVSLDDKSRSFREVVRHSGGCCLLGLTNNNEVLLVKQFRYPYKEVIYEIPAGKFNPHEKPIECAVREFEEETGYIARDVQFFGEIYPTPGYCSEIIYLFFSSNLKKTAQRLDEGEFLQVEAIPLNKAVDLVLCNEIKDAKSIVAILRIDKLLNKTNCNSKLSI